MNLFANLLRPAMVARLLPRLLPMLAVGLAFQALAGGVEEKSGSPVVELESKSGASGISLIEISGLNPGQEIEIRIRFADGRELNRRMKVAEGSNKVTAKLAGKGADMNGLALKAKPKGSQVKVNGRDAGGQKTADTARAPAHPPAPVSAPRKPVAAFPSAPLPSSALKLGEMSKDCQDCPEMIAVPAGEFVMGTESSGYVTDAPRRTVAMPYTYSISRHEVTFAQWEACVADGGCAGYTPNDEGWGKGSRPAINVSWNDAKRYLEWLSKKTGKRYRLPSEAEWEYAARAGTNTAFWWGREAGRNNANCFDCGGEGGSRTVPVGSHKANPLGLHDTAGNVWEWVEDCYDEEAYTRFDEYPKPFGGSTGCYRGLRGGAWDMLASGLQVFFRYSAEPGSRANNIGFRVVRED